MSWSIEKGGLDIFGLDRFGEYNSIGLLAFDIGIEVDDFYSYFQVVQQCHYLNLICLFINLLHFSLAEEFDRQLVLDKGLIEDRVIFEFSRGEKPHHEYEIVRDGGITKDGDDIIHSFYLDIVEFL
jgi:hypothetical protein